MKSRLAILAAVGLLSTSALAIQTPNQQKARGFDRSHLMKSNATDENSAPVNINDVSYSFGFMMGGNMTRQKMDLNVDQFITGMKDALAGKDGKFDRKDMMKMLMAYQKEVRQKQAEERKAQANENKAKGDAFLAKNKAKSGVVALPSGLQYRVIEKGQGAVPTENDKVKVTYTGKLISGDEFASSDDESKPAVFSLKQVIPGWREALQKMPAGSTWELYVPSDLAYGARGTRGKIGPNETLVFTIKLLSIDKDAAKQAPITGDASKSQSQNKWFKGKKSS